MTGPVRRAADLYDYSRSVLPASCASPLDDQVADCVLLPGQAPLISEALEPSQHPAYHDTNLQEMFAPVQAHIYLTCTCCAALAL